MGRKSGLDGNWAARCRHSFDSLAPLDSVKLFCESPLYIAHVFSGLTTRTTYFAIYIRIRFD